MYLLPGDPKMVNALDRLIDSFPQLFIIKHPEYQNRFLLNAIVENLEKGKTSLVIVPDNEDGAELQSFFQQNKIQDWCLNIEHEEAISHTELAKLKKNKNASIKSSNYDLYQLTKENVIDNFAKVSTSYNLITKEIVQNKSWRDLIQYLDNTDIPDVYQSFVNKLKDQSLTVTYLEYGEIRHFIEQAEGRYKDNYRFLSENDLIQYTELFNPKEAIETLTQFLDNTNECIFDLNLLVDNYSRENQNKALNDIKRYESLLSKIQEDLLSHRTQHGELALGKSGSISNTMRRKFNAGYRSHTDESEEIRMVIEILKEDLESSDYFNFEIQTVNRDRATIEDYLVWIDNTSLYLKNWKIDLELYNDSNIKQLNCQNGDLKELNHIDRRFRKILAKLNESNILTKKFEDNTFNILKKIEFVRQVHYDISKSLWRLKEYPDYIEYRSMLAKQSEKSIAIVDVLKNYDYLNWVGLLDSYYMHDAIYQNANSEMPVNGGVINTYIESLSLLRSKKIAHIQSEWTTKRKSAIHKLEIDDPDTYKSLFVGATNLNWVDVLMNHHAFLQDIYPIIIIKESIYRKSTFPMHLIWDTLWVKNMTEHRSIDLDQLRAHSRKQYFVSTNQVSKMQLSSLSYLTDKTTVMPKVSVLDVEYTSTGLPFKLMKNTDRLRAAKEISSQMAFANQKLRIFQLKNVSILSYFGDYLNDQLIGFLKNKGLKEIIPNSDINLGLTDVLVKSDNDIVICTEDGVFDLDQIESSEWQNIMLSKLIRLGSHHVDIWSADIFMQYPYYVRRSLYKAFDKIQVDSMTPATLYDQN